MKTLVRVFALAVFLFIGQSAQAVLEIEITQGRVGCQLRLPFSLVIRIPLQKLSRLSFGMT